ncbi:Delta-hexatoxin-Mg1a like [Melia azedarach]|uniref:Delta-hexatoxin-Mg1a like n=2 Tax=Melia azedarach TaxID=155640 RepID=A0ACC1WVD0_MELAZ|nr:Delta-hexatoxin-Mg1a like [Melia azedarach]KAJ4703166.1 Delta-hexatoxin-Mg1a like [Melia azedarach]
MQQHKASNINTKFSEKMAASAPVAIGTRGTVGSLVRREIEYFSKFELERHASFRKPQGQIVDIASRSGQSRNGLWFMIMRWKRKKQRGSSGILPSFCSAVEVSDRNRLNGIPGFNYRILKNDVNNFHF